MKKLFFERSEKKMLRLFSHNLFPLIVAPFIVFLFFLPNLVKDKIPIPADANFR